MKILGIKNKIGAIKPHLILAITSYTKPYPILWQRFQSIINIAYIKRFYGRTALMYRV